MSTIKKVLQGLNPFHNCKKYNIPIWQCPSFLFLLMGLFIIVVMLITYSIANLRISDPTIVSILVMGVTFILLIIDFFITRSFERISEANRMKSEFISVVSHQLRSPLTNLKYSLEFLMSDKLKNVSKDELEYFKILEENTKRMGDLINNLLIVSRIETSQLPLRKEEFSFIDLTKKMIMKFKVYSEATNVKIKLKTEKNLPNVLADPFWVEQTIQNLLDNAIRYSHSGDEIEISIKPDSKKLIFCIQDSGVGIPKLEQKYIFQKFFRSKNALKYQTQGSGLGLHIVKQVLSLMKGKIWFKSKEDQGTTFYFSLPIKV